PCSQRRRPAQQPGAEIPPGRQPAATEQSAVRASDARPLQKFSASVGKNQCCRNRRSKQLNCAWGKAMSGAIHEIVTVPAPATFIFSGMSAAEPLTLESVAGQAPGSRILRLSGPLVINNMFEFQSVLRNDPPQALILDLSAVPYMDSAGMGAIINYYVSCQRAGRKMVVAGVNGRGFE